MKPVRLETLSNAIRKILDKKKKNINHIYMSINN
jgi:hypothetical protein